MRRGRILHLSGLFIVLGLSGCATPQSVRDLAGHGAATVGMAETSLRQYLELTGAQLAARMALMQADAQRDATDASEAAFERFLVREAGAGEDEVAAKLRELGDERRRLRDKQADEFAALAKKFSLDTASLPQVQSEKLAEARKGFGVLAEELSPEEWVTFAAGYAKAIKTEVDKLRQDKLAQPTGGE